MARLDVQSEPSRIFRPLPTLGQSRLSDRGPSRLQMMVFALLSAVFRRESTGMPHLVVPDEEARRISVALIHIRAHGNLDRFAASRSGKQAILATVSRRRLVTWRRKHTRYELTKAGQRFAAHGTSVQAVPGETAQGRPLVVS
jgi:hypothetical protein